ASFSSQKNVSCHGGSDGSATISPSGGTAPYNYLWSNAQTTATASSLAAGSHSVTITDANACQIVRSIIITEPTELLGSIIITDSIDCSGGSNASALASANGGTSPYSYSWSNGQTSAKATGLSAGSHYLSITDANGCVFLDTVTITEPSGLSASMSVLKNVSCNAGNDGSASAVVSGGTAPYSYSWSNGQTTSTATGLGAGTYSVSITDSKGCSIMDSVLITQPNPISSTTTVIADVSCNAGNDASARASATGGTAPYSYQWSNGQGSATSTGLSAGKHYVSITDANSCVKKDSVTITEPAVLAASFSSQKNVSCHGGNDGNATISPSGGTAPYSYL